MNTIPVSFDFRHNGLGAISSVQRLPLFTAGVLFVSTAVYIINLAVYIRPVLILESRLSISECKVIDLIVYV